MCQVKRELSSEISQYIISHNPEILQCLGILLGEVYFKNRQGMGVRMSLGYYF
jgi:hypothetical protein